MSPHQPRRGEIWLVISKERLLQKWGTVSPEALARIEKALLTALGM